MLHDISCTTYAGFKMCLFCRLRCGVVWIVCVDSCPWSKALWLDSLSRLRLYLTEDETRGLVQAATEKGILVRSKQSHRACM